MSLPRAADPRVVEYVHISRVTLSVCLPVSLILMVGGVAVFFFPQYFTYLTIPAIIIAAFAVAPVIVTVIAFPFALWMPLRTTGPALALLIVSCLSGLMTAILAAPVVIAMIVFGVILLFT